MTTKERREYRFLLIRPFTLPGNGRFKGKVAPHLPGSVPKEQRLRFYKNIKHLMEDVEWDLHEGPLAPYGDWPVETMEEKCLVAAARLPIVREACESGKYNAIILLGGIDPGFLESREIGRRYKIPVTSSAFSQMHIACMLGNKFSIIDKAEVSIINQYHLVVQYHFAHRCASVRNINIPQLRPGYTDGLVLVEEEQKVLRGETSEAVERTVKESVAAIEEDGAEVINLGCSSLFWLQPYLQRRLNEMGWEVPVLEGYGCSIILAKTLVSLGVDASGLAFPSDRPKKWRRRKLI
jgi:allantoin racemase